MKKWKIPLYLFFIVSTRICYSQQLNNPNNHIVEDAVENSAETINESGQFEIPDELVDLIQHPLNINNDKLEIFVRYNLISQTQLTSLNEYIIQNGNLVELEELQQIDGFEKKTIQLILPYITLQTQNISPSSQQITIRFQRKLNNTISEYPGSNDKLVLKYRGKISNSINISFTGEKDPGEKYFPDKKKGFDFNSINVFYKGNSLVNKIIIGDYNIEYGQGLTAWSGSSFGGGNEITGIFKYGRGIVPYSGTDENRFMRGIAFGMEKNKLRFDGWYSNHSIDGNKVIDTLSNDEFVTSIQTSGYHRSISENEDYHSLREFVYGSSVIYSTLNFTTGLSVYYQHFQLPLENTKQPYSKFEFSGNNNFNAGWHFSITKKNILFFGENSYCRNNSFAFLNGLVLSIDPKLSVSFLWRSYSLKYTNLKSNAFGKNTDNRNENGLYFGINYKINRQITYSGFVDIYSFPFIKYRTDLPSNGYDFFHQLQFNPNKKFTGIIRFRNHLQQINSTSEDNNQNHLSDYNFNSFRASARFKIDNIWEYSFRAELVFQSADKIKSGSGTMISQDLFFHPMGKSYSANLRYAVFNCPQFETRIYEYENDVQGAFSIPFYYGSGSRFYTNLNFKLNRSITLSLRYAISWIEEETTPHSEIKFQLRISLK